MSETYHVQPTTGTLKPELSVPADTVFPPPSDASLRLQGKKDAMIAEPPSNEQVVKVLDTVSDSLKAEGDGGKVARHAAELIEATRDLVTEKNKGEHLQKAFKASAMAARNLKEGTPEWEELKEKGHKHLRSVPQITRDLFYALLTDTDFRTNVADLLEHLEILFKNDPKSELQIPDGYHVDTSKPILTSTTVTPSGNSVTTSTKKVIPITPNATTSESNPGVEHSTQLTAPSKDVDMNEEHQHKEKKHHKKDKKTDEKDDPNYMPISVQTQDRMRQTWNNMLLRFAQHPQWSRLLNDIFELIDIMKPDSSADSGKPSKHDHEAAAEESTGITEKIKEVNPEAARAARHMQSFVKNFVEDETLANLTDRLHKISSDIRSDVRLREWLSDLRSYIRMIMRNPRRDLETEKMRERGNDLFADGHRLLSTSDYRTDLVKLAKDWKDLIKQVGEDKELNAFTKALKKLRDDITIAKPDGSIKLDFNALIELRGAVLSVMLSMLKDVKLPTYEGEEGHYKFKVSDMSLEVDDILPSQISVLHETAANFVVPQLGNVTSKTVKPAPAEGESHAKSWVMGKLIVRAENIITAFKNCKFWYQHTTFPKTQDSGEADIDITGRGINVEIEFLMETNDKGAPSFTNGVVWVDIDKFKVTLRNTSHGAFYRFFKKTINKRIGQLVATQMANKLAEATGTAATAFNQLIAKASPEQFLNSFMSTVDNVSSNAKGSMMGKDDSSNTKGSMMGKDAKSDDKADKKSEKKAEKEEKKAEKDEKKAEKKAEKASN